MRPYLKKTHHKKGLVQGVDPEFKPQYHKTIKIEFLKLLKSP
jgi:hypothetical protein